MPAEHVDGRALALASALETLAAGYPDPLLLVGRSGTVLGATAALEARGGIPRDAVIGSLYTQWAADVDRPIIDDHFSRALEGETCRFRTVGRPDGVGRAELTYSPVAVDGEVIAVLVYAFAIAEVEERERAKQQADELLRIAGELASSGGWSLDRDSSMLTLSPESQRILGTDGEPALPFEHASALFAPGNADAIARAVDACFESGETIDLDLLVTTADGRTRIVKVLGRPTTDAAGAIVAAHGAIWDVTEATAERERAAALQQRLDLTLNSLSDGLILLDDEWRLVYANDRAEELIGRPFSEIEGHSLWESFPELADTELEVAYQRTAREQIRTTVRTAGTGPAKGRFFDVTAYPTATGIALYIRDVTEDERARHEMVKAQRRIADQAALIDASRDAIIVRSLDGVIHYWNRSAETLYGVTADDAIGGQVRDLICVADEVFEQGLAVTLREGYWSEELHCTTRDGRSLIIDCCWQLLPGEDGAPDRIFSVDTDVTAWRREENLRTRATRMESLGTFAGGIAHDLNNVLTPILMSIQLLESTETDPDRLELLSTMESASKRGADMIRQVLAFARGVEGRRDRVAIDALLVELQRFAADALPGAIRFTAEVDDGLPHALGDPTQLIQVLMNLVTNARDAMPDGGELRVTASTLILEDSFSTEAFQVEPGAHIIIDVVDTGHGMTPQTAEKIFEPFYTTKSVGKGTGLGLASSLAIVQSHGGTIRVYSEPERGTRFSVILPIAIGDDSSPAEPRVPTRTLPRGHGELILVVDDDPTIRLITARTLQSYEYRTLVAENGRDAIALVEAPGASVDLVLTDMMMPVMDGAATTAYLEEHHPGIPVIAASGLTSAGGAARSAGMGVAAFLPKPYTTSLLLTTIRDVLDGGAAREHDEQNGSSHPSEESR
ncbi:MAG: PAS domain-containing protein [Microcella sp.]|uniref:hybrid sensor histidine kinase/response regulator n=1 Tax=Microcella sp. TaxID=1913979 RepID=UPI00271B0D26|nr:PAS domain-containing protein [Microcella sp.]MDO8338957.1 PAS domain-containing protein [Microcella sp.]